MLDSVSHTTNVQEVTFHKRRLIDHQEKFVFFCLYVLRPVWIHWPLERDSVLQEGLNWNAS